MAGSATQVDGDASEVRLHAYDYYYRLSVATCCTRRHVSSVRRRRGSMSGQILLNSELLSPMQLPRREAFK